MVKETHWLEAFLLPLPLTWTLNRVSGDQKYFLDENIYKNSFKTIPKNTNSPANTTGGAKTKLLKQ